MSRILLFGCGHMPLTTNSAVDGAGFRTWQLYNGLKSQAHTVYLANYSYDGTSLNTEKSIFNDFNSNFSTKTTQDELINYINPEVIVYYYWPIIQIANNSHINHIPVCIDFAGSVLIEKHFQNNGLNIDCTLEKLKKISIGDFFSCSGERQYHYFSSILLLIGITDVINSDILNIIPLSGDPNLPTKVTPIPKNCNLKCIHCGYFHPWQDPIPGLQRVADYVKKEMRLELDIYGIPSSTDPILDHEIIEKIGIHPRLHYMGCQSYNQVVKAIMNSNFAIDLMSKSLERELAMNIRTLQYLWSGIPIIYNDYAEISPLIMEYKAGWCIDPINLEKIDGILKIILDNPNILDEYGKNGQKLILDKFNWEKTIKPLSDFCKNPKKRRRNVIYLKEFYNNFPKNLINLLYDE